MFQTLKARAFALLILLTGCSFEKVEGLSKGHVNIGRDKSVENSGRVPKWEFCVREALDFQIPRVCRRAELLRRDHGRRAYRVCPTTSQGIGSSEEGAVTGACPRRFAQQKLGGLYEKSSADCGANRSICAAGAVPIRTAFRARPA